MTLKRDDRCAIDFTQEGDLVHPRPPVISSQGAGWDRLQLSLFKSLPPHCIPEHYAPHHSICINYGDRLGLQMTVDGLSTAVEVIPCAIGIFPANIWQTFVWHQQASFLDLYLEPALLNQASIELCDKDSVELVPILGSCADPLIYQIAVALKTALEVDRSSSRLYADAMGTALAAHLLARYSTRQPAIQQYSGKLSRQKLQQVTTYIQEHLDQELSLAELANLVNLSPFHFARIFKQSIGMAPHRYHLQCRVDRAKQLLLARELGMAEIACAVGFASQGHLNYHFKRFVGVTPRVFLQQQ